MTTNPLVAGRPDTPPDAWAGVWIAEDIQLIERGIRDGSWIDGTLGVIGAGLDALAFVSDPVGALLQYGIAWIIEHVRPLSEALDRLAGDPAQITAHATTWRNVADSMRRQADELASAVRLDVAGWGGTAGPAYRAWAAQREQAINGLARAATTMATITECSAALVAAVRVLVRDAIATCVSRLVVYAAEEVASLGFATPLVVEQVTTLVAAWAARIARLLRGLLASLRQLAATVRRLGALIDQLKQILSRLHRSPLGGSPGPGPGRPSPARELIDRGHEFKGRRLPQQGGPAGGVLYKRNPQTGEITNYTLYDEAGNAVKRVDLTGRDHAGIPTPHVVEYDVHRNPTTGQVFVREQRHVRPARADEIP